MSWFLLACVQTLFCLKTSVMRRQLHNPVRFFLRLGIYIGLQSDNRPSWVLICRHLCFCSPTWPKCLTVFLENVPRLDQRRGKELGFQLSHRQPIGLEIPCFSYVENWKLVKSIVGTKFRWSHVCLHSQAGNRLWQLMALLFFVMLW